VFSSLVGATLNRQGIEEQGGDVTIGAAGIVAGHHDGAGEQRSTELDLIGRASVFKKKASPSFALDSWRMHGES
jgi:hypothetical protein